MFGTDLLAPLAPEPKGALRSFRLDQGHLIPGPGTPLALPPDPAGPPIALGLAAHPTLPLLYVGFPARNQVGVYGYDREAALRPLAVAANSGKAPCWLTINHAGTRLYTTNTPDGTVSTYDTTDPSTREKSGRSRSATRRPIFGEGKMAAVSSGPTQLSLDPEGRVLVRGQPAPDGRIRSSPAATRCMRSPCARTARSPRSCRRSPSPSRWRRAQGIVVF